MMSKQFIDITFGDSPLEKLLAPLGPGASLPAAAFLAAVEGETEDTVREVLDHLWDLSMTLDISELPDFGASGDLALRLRTEAAMVKQGNWAENLEDSDPLRLYFEELAGIPALGDLNLMAMELEAHNREEEKNPQLHNAIMNLCFGRVVELAGEYVGHGVLLLDLIQEGSMGLWANLENYGGGDFQSFRDQCIRFAMAKTVVMQARENGVGQKLRQAAEDYRAVDQWLLGELGRNPTLEEIAQGLHMTAEETTLVANMLENARTVNRAKAATEEKEETPEDEMKVEDTAYFQMRQRIGELLSSLSPEDARLLSLRFGLEGGLPLSPEETARALSLTAAEVLTRESSALAALRSQRS